MLIFGGVDEDEHDEGEARKTISSSCMPQEQRGFWFTCRKRLHELDFF